MSKIHLISGPRNLSTALMYSFGNREDISIIDEPFYAYYLHKHPEVEHPGKEEILMSQSTRLVEVIESIETLHTKNESIFIKNMAHHILEIDWSFLLEFQNILLVRHPRQLIASFAQVIPEPSIQDIGIKAEYEIMKYLIEKEAKFCVIDSADILENPKESLVRLCSFLQLDFKKGMLSWRQGPRKEDGVWAKYWYANVHQSTGFQRQSTSERPFPQEHTALLDEALFYYNEIRKFKI